MTSVKHLLKWFWIVGPAVWLSMVLLQSWQLKEAETPAQSSFFETRLMSPSLFGVFWGIAQPYGKRDSRKRGKARFSGSQWKWANWTVPIHSRVLSGWAVTRPRLQDLPPKRSIRVGDAASTENHSSRESALGPTGNRHVGCLRAFGARDGSEAYGLGVGRPAATSG